MLRQSPRQSIKDKCKYVTLQNLQQQRELKKRLKKKITLDAQHVDKAREDETYEEVGESEHYDVEMAWAATIAKNNAKLAQLGLQRLASSLAISDLGSKKNH
ncbi:hypothetical protein M5689_020699 [Euphorbia peplus]|nr:hypothetical protein M5689_020699 [Euphorbia peplus]